MTTAYFDCFNGAAGDMTVASLIHAGADADSLRSQLAALPVTGYELTIEPITKQGFAATRFHVALDKTAKQPHRHLKHIVEILDGSKLSASVIDKAKRIFTRLAEAEAKVHGTSIEKVHFHEVGAVDAILDVTGAVIALESLGVDRIVVSPIPVGSGTVTCDHGIMPVPAPATAELLRGVPIAPTEETGELTTPTGAAILTTLADAFGPMPDMRIERIGYGAGTRDGRTRPNVLRVMVGSAAAAGETDEVAVLETNLDDATPEVIAHAMDRLLEAGALDVYALPIQMKKGRGGTMLCVLCDTARAGEFESLLFVETPTFGVRRTTMRRAKLGRRLETVETEYGTIRIKVGTREGVTTSAPEFEDCRAAAQAHHVALRTVMTAAQHAWQLRSR